MIIMIKMIYLKYEFDDYDKTAHFYCMNMLIMIKMIMFIIWKWWLWFKMLISLIRICWLWYTSFSWIYTVISYFQFCPWISTLYGVRDGRVKLVILYGKLDRPIYTTTENQLLMIYGFTHLCKTKWHRWRAICIILTLILHVLYVN